MEAAWKIYIGFKAKLKQKRLGVKTIFYNHFRIFLKSFELHGEPQVGA